MRSFRDEIRILSGLDEETEIIAKDEWQSLRKIDGWYTYTHEEKSNGHGVAILGFKRVGREEYKFVGRFENTPPHRKGIKLASLTGGVEKGDIEGTAVMEFWQEAGIRIKAEQLIPLGTLDVYKGSDTVSHLFAVDCQNLDIGKSVGDGSKGEKDAYCRWVSEDDIIKCSDPTNHALLLRWRHNQLFKQG